MIGGVRRAAFVRCVPFLAFMAFVGLRAFAPDDGSWGFDARWLYAAQVAVVGTMLAWWWRDYGELSRQTVPSATDVALAIGVGLVVFVLWIQLDAPWMTLATPGAVQPFAPLDAAGRIDWALAVPRWLGAALLVPVMEELFLRSFLMRWIQSPRFEGVLPQAVGLRAVVLSTFVFVLAHTLWLAAIVAGLAYAWLYIRTGKLWVAVIAHAVTNGALGVWVLATGNWQFW